MGELRENQKRLIEKTGVFLESEGVPPAEGRILGLLLVGDDLEYSFEDICSLLNLSKSAVSNGLNSLMRQSRVEYITRPGDRKRYFRSKIIQWPDFLKAKFHRMLELREHFEEILAQRDPSTIEFNKRIQEFIEFQQFLSKELPQVFKRWEESRGS
jgi:DNA-binding transcriptional regulator GbsR (MarR family)